MLIRPEEDNDRAVVYAVNASAFETTAEARLVDALRREARPVISLVAEDSGTLVGHIMFSPVVLPGHPKLNLMGLAPMAVAPTRQRQGIGSVLVHAGIERCRQLGVGGVVVLGHPRFYPRFGFVPAASFGLSCVYDVPSEVFMALELQPRVFSTAFGCIEYHAVFAGV